MPRDKQPEMELGWEPESLSFHSQPRLLPVSENESQRCQSIMDETSTANLQHDLFSQLKPIKGNLIDWYQQSMIQMGEVILKYTRISFREII